jgi:urease gamma subunit
VKLARRRGTKHPKPPDHKSVAMIKSTLIERIRDTMVVNEDGMEELMA